MNNGERTGRGIPNIFRIWREHKWPEPVIAQSFDPDETRFTLYFTSENGSAADEAVKNETTIKAVRRQMIVVYLTDHISAKTAELAEYLSLKPSRTRDYLRELIRDGIVIAEGTNSDRVYKLKS